MHILGGLMKLIMNLIIKYTSLLSQVIHDKLQDGRLMICEIDLLLIFVNA